MKDQRLTNILLIFVTICLIVTIILLYFSSKRINNLQQIETMYIVSQDSLRFERSKNNEQTATIEVLTSENTALFTKLKSSDASINRLQNLVKEYELKIGKLNTAIVTSNTTIVNLQDSIKSIIIGYTNNIDTPSITYPIYNREFTKEWYNGEVTMGLTKLDLNIKIKNDYDVTIGSEKISLFKRKMYANITNLNPDTETTVMKVYQKQEVKTNTLKTFGIGSAVGFAVGLLILK
jgi:hypothetical protein